MELFIHVLGRNPLFIVTNTNYIRLADSLLASKTATWVVQEALCGLRGYRRVRHAQPELCIQYRRID